MNIKANIRKTGVIAIWCGLAIGVSVLLIAAINKKNSRSFQGIAVKINDGKPAMFIDKKEVVHLLAPNGIEQWNQKKLASFDLQQLETRIRNNAWVNDVQLYFDNNEMLQVRITERQPVARIFAVDGKSFYIDSSGVQLPVVGRLALRLPLFTGYPADRFARHGHDSLLSQQVRTLALFMGNDSFWSAAIEQINIVAGRQFEMVPVIGNHIIDFGDGSDYQDKFHRLLLFYRQVMAVKGFDSYARVKLAYAGQVVGTKKGGYMSRADSLLAIKNVRELIRTAQRMDNDTARLRDMKPLEHNNMTEQTLQGYDLPEDSSHEQTPRQGGAPEKRAVKPKATGNHHTKP